MNPTSEHDPLAPLADEFLERARRGERPSPQEYAARHPELATQIHELFPALMVMENLGGSVAGMLATAPAASAPPARLGEYRILRQIGHGGMGVVYEAVQETLGRHVAVKVLPAHLAERGKFLERFRREAKAAARLHHSNIVPVFGVGECDGLHFYAMQFIHGQALDKVLEDVRRIRSIPGEATVTHVAAPPSIAESLVLGQFDPPALEACPPAPSGSQALSGTRAHYCREVARLGAQVAEGLAYAHSQGVLHRDVKPANLLLDAQGTLWITDFGLAKADDSDALTEAGDIVGTLRYMAPERFDGQSDGRSDVYGLGATLYEMLTLRPAFDDSDRAKLVGRITRHAPPPLRAVDQTITRDLETVVLKAMARDPADRYPTAADLAEDLRRFLSDRPVLARRHTVGEQVVRWTRRNRGVAALVSTVAVLLVTMTVGAVAYSVNLDRALDREKAALATAKVAERERTFQLYNARVAEARAGRLSRRIGQRYVTLDVIRDAARLARELELPASHRDELRNLAIAALVLPDVRHVPEALPKARAAIHLSADFGLSVEPGAGATGEFTDLRRGRVLTPAPKPGSVFDSNVRVSPGGRFAAIWAADNPRTFRLWEITPSGARPVLEDPGVYSATFGPTGERLVVCYLTGRTALIDCATGKEVRAIKTWPAPLPLVMAVDPSGRRLAVSRVDRVEIIDLTSGAEIAVIPQSVSIIPGLAWHPAGNVLAASADDYKVYAWDLRTRKAVTVFEGLAAHGIRLAFNPRGDRLVACDWSGDVRFWDARTGTQILRADGAFWSPAFRSDERRFAGILDAHQGLFEIAPERAYASLVRDTSLGKSDYWHPAISPDGRWLAVGMDDGVGLWDLITDEFAAFLPIGIVRHVSFGHDGSLYTGTNDLLIRWPLTQNGPESYRVGPPERWGGANRGNVGVSFDGHVIATTYISGTEIIDRRRPGRVVRAAPMTDARSIDVSPDGRLVAVGAWLGMGVRVLDASSGRIVASLAGDGAAHTVQFSPDGRWLATTGGGARIWDTKTWQERRLERPVGNLHAFTWDGSIAAAALAGGSGWIGLFDVASGKELARLEDPHGSGVTYLRFSRDGGILAAVNKRGFVVQRWDLRVIRAQLAELGLDWEAPPLPPPPPVVADYRPPPRVDVIGAEIAADPAKLESQEVRNWVSRLWSNPYDPLAHYHIGLFQLARKRDFAAANRHLTAAIAFGLRDARAQRAIVLYRLNRWNDAVADVNKILAFDTATTTLLTVRGNAYRQLHRYREAIEDFTTLIARDPPTWQLHDWRAACHDALGEPDRAAADRREVLRIDPAAAETLNGHAWRMLTGPPAGRDDLRALDIASRAVKLRPDDPLLRNTLGIAEYRNGLVTRAVATLEKSLALGNGKFAGFDLYFLAMCHHKLGNAAAARDCLNRAVKWTTEVKDLSPSHQRELLEFRREAESLLKGR